MTGGNCVKKVLRSNLLAIQELRALDLFHWTQNHRFGFLGIIL